MKKILILLSIAIIAVSCDVAKNVAGTYSLTQCEYKYSSISNVNLAGINVQSDNGQINPLAAAGLLNAFSKATVPLQFTLNLNVKNPNYQTALFNGMQYALDIDNIEMTTGLIDSKMQIATGQIAQLPVNISFDLKKAMKGESGETVKNLAYNFIGIGDKPTNVTLRIKPTINIGGQLLPSPMYIPISFTYGKNNK